MFTGGPTFYDNGTEALKFPADQPRYVGEPSKDIDDAWNALTRDRYIILTEHEAREAWGPEYTEFWDEDKQAYLAGLESFHLLHCLDHLRQSFYPDHYTHTGIHGVLHRDHCIDALRQMLQCVVDVTPIPTRYYPGIGHNYIDSDREHTCRDFDQMRVWMSHRTATTIPQ